MKNKFLWLPVAFLAVAVVGAAVWFGNTAPVEARANPAQVSCGTSWKRVFNATVTGDDGLVTVTQVTTLDDLKNLLNHGCSLKVVGVSSSNDSMTSFECGEANVSIYPAGSIFECQSSRPPRISADGMEPRPNDGNISFDIIFNNSDTYWHSINSVVSSYDDGNKVMIFAKK